MTSTPPARSAVAPLYLAGFTTAFGAHGVASVLGAETDDIGMTLLGLGAILALYDVAEVILKPVFGALSDRIGAKPVIVGGLIAFVLASAVGMLTAAPVALAAARLAQGAAASAFSPASSAAVARMAGKQQRGRYFGRYGAWKSLGYVFGPLIGVALAYAFGIRAVYAALVVISIVAAVWVLLAMPSLPVVPRPRYTLLDLVKQTIERGFLLPTLLLAATTGILGVAVGFLPLLATRLGLHPLVGAAAVAVLAVGSSIAQPFVGRWRDAGRLTTRTGAGVGMLLMATGIALLALWPTAAVLFIAAALVGGMIGTVTPLAFAHLADATPEERMGRTMGNAELGRELGDAGGPLLVGAIASAWTLPAALLVLAGAGAAAGVAGWAGLRATALR